MAKYIINKSLGVICLGDKNFIPGAPGVVVTDEEIEHPIIAAYIKTDKLAVEEGADADPLAGMTVAQLKAYAAEMGIDLGAATAKADILAAIKAGE